MKYDFSKLNGKIVEKYKTNSNFARAMNLSKRSLSLKLNNIREFKPSEIECACILLKIPKEEIHKYFFAEIVQND